MNKSARGLERSLVLRRRILLAAWVLSALAVVGRAAEVQVLEGTLWREAALGQHKRTSEVAAPRGAILDREGVPLAVSREAVRVSVAPREVADVEVVRRLLVEALGVSPAQARRHTDPSNRWSVVPGHYEPAVMEALSGVRGLYLERVHRRFYPRGELARGVLGSVIDGVGEGGIEQAFDSVLGGRPGREMAARDSHGREIPGETVLLESPVAGADVRLTLDLDLQEIGHETLAEALEKTGARGGDLLVMDPRTGEVLAMVSLRDGRSDVLSAVTTPYEPGSTLKPFTVAAILEHDAGTLADSIDTQGGVWMVGGRPLTDVHGYGTLTLAEALRESSNVGVAMAAQALEPGEQYETLRDFGFGVQTGIPLPGEAAGILRRPERWSARSFASLAIGYEIAVTPLQMAMAYGAIANHGVLMEPRLVREVRSSSGRVLERPRPRAVRRVVSQAVVRELGEVLVDVVEDGTGTAARLETFRVAGKTGTSRAYAAGGGYGVGRYFSSFAAYFPADDPQLVIFVKLEAPRGAYYGGATAAPVSRETMEAVLAARRTPLDRGALLRWARREPAAEASSEDGAAPGRDAPLPDATSRTQPVSSPPDPVRFASLDPAPAAPTFRAPADLPAAFAVATGGTEVPEVVEVRVPDVSGLSPRVAARKLHAVGLRVQWDGGSKITGSMPPAGAKLLPGDTVQLRTAAGR